MSDSPVPYKKLSRRARTWFGISQIWQGPDHLLAVASTLGVERYRRFYFRDVEAITMRRTSQRAAFNAVLSVLALALFGLALAVYGTAEAASTGTLVFASGLCFCAGITFATLLWNSFLGPTCAVSLQTRAGVSRLHGFNRLRPAQRALETLRAEIASAQSLPPRLPGE